MSAVLSVSVCLLVRLKSGDTHDAHAPGRAHASARAHWGLFPAPLPRIEAERRASGRGETRRGRRERGKKKKRRACVVCARASVYVCVCFWCARVLVTSSDPPARASAKGGGVEEQWPRRTHCLPAKRAQDSPVTSGATSESVCVTVKTNVKYFT